MPASVETQSRTTTPAADEAMPASIEIQLRTPAPAADEAPSPSDVTMAAPLAAPPMPETPNQAVTQEATAPEMVPESIAPVDGASDLEEARGAIIAPIPLPHPKPSRPAVAQRDRLPLPRARPARPAPKSIFAPVAANDDRYPAR
jgi:hypothetical protein